VTTGRQTVLPAGGRATFRSKALVLLGTLLILGSMLAIAAGRPGSVLGAPPASTISALTIGTIGAQVAGVPFTVTVTAYGSNGSVKTSFTGPVTLSGLASSIGCSGCLPVIAPAAPTYGSFTWNNGVGTAQVTAKRAGAATLTATAGSVSDGEPFSVSAGSLGDVTFENGSFDGQPIDAEPGYPINSVCLPSAGADPCGPGSTPTKVQAVDAYGNLKSNVTIDITSTPSGVAGTLSGVTDANGEASFANLVFGTVGSTAVIGSKTLTASSATATATSASFSVVNDLSACDGTSCKNNTSNGKAANAGLQRAWGRITTDGDFFVLGSTNVRLTTAFAPSGATSGECGSNVTIGDSTDLKIAGLGTGDTAPSTTMVLVLPSDSLKFYGITSRGTPSFNVCLGALNVDPDSNATTWQQKNLGKKGGLTNSTSTENDPEGRAWGVPADCGTTGLSTSDPCIGLRTKSANQAQTYLGLSSTEFAELGISENDLVIVIEKRAPWDGKGGVF